MNNNNNILLLSSWIYLLKMCKTCNSMPKNVYILFTFLFFIPIISFKISFYWPELSTVILNYNMKSSLTNVIIIKYIYMLRILIMIRIFLVGLSYSCKNYCT